MRAPLKIREDAVVTFHSRLPVVTSEPGPVRTTARGATSARVQGNQGSSRQRAYHRALGNRKIQESIPATQPISARIQRRWDAAKSECAREPTDKWIERLVIQQETPQDVTAHWSDGSEESGTCSTGKGHCCVDAGDPDGVACTQSGSTADGSNCTPITTRNGYRVRHRDVDHRGIAFWTEFVPSRGIALHKYAPVDGTPLSHGCVRLNENMAKKVFCGVRQNRTWVQVQGFARPMCDHPTLRAEWAGDFAWGGRDLSDFDGDTASQNSILETRRMLRASFGRRLSVEEIRRLGPDDIPRCTHRVTRPHSDEETEE